MPDGKLALENMQCSRKTILAMINASHTAPQLLANAQLQIYKTICISMQKISSSDIRYLNFTISGRSYLRATIFK
jgi:hypothetical protein